MQAVLDPSAKHADATVGATITGLSALNAGLCFLLDPIDCLERHVARLGPVISVELGLPNKPRQRTLILVGPTYNREVLTATDKIRPTGIWPLRGPKGSAQNNLRATYLSLSGDAHHQLASAAGTTLERPLVLKHFDPTRRIAAAHVARWPLGEVVDIHKLTRDLAQHYAFELVFGETDSEVWSRFGQLLADYHAANWTHTPRLKLDLPGFPYHTLLRRADQLQAFILEWIERAKACPHFNIRSVMGSFDSLEPEEAAAHLAGFAMASYETTNSVLTWALTLLACHPAILADLQGELDNAASLETLSAQSLNALPLLDGVIRETMRLIAPAPFLGFKMTRKDEIAGIALEAGSTVIVSPHLTHRIDTLYPEPRRFKPERWRTIRPNTYEYLPFSGGPRRCPGHLFAQNNLKIALATIVSKLDFSLHPKTRIDYTYAALTIPANGVMMEFSQRRDYTKPKASRILPRGTFFNLFDLPCSAEL